MQPSLMNKLPCRDCDNLYPEDELTDGYCSSCYEDLPCCDFCGEHIIGEGFTNQHRTTICESCHDDHSICEGCGYWTSNDDLDDSGYCEECHEEDEEEDEDEDEGCYFRGINPSPNFLPKHKEGQLYLGVELETDDHDDRYSACEELHSLNPDEDIFFLKADGSLNCGIEIVSHPATLQYHKTRFPWEEIRTIVKHYGGESHNTTTAGLHIHFNSNYFGARDSFENDLHTLKLLHIFERFWDELTIFSRRDTSSLNEWASRYYTSFNEGEEAKVNDLKHNGGKSRAVNIIHPHTIEIRLFRGTLKLETLFACMELVDFLARFVKSHSIRTISQLSWEKLVGYIQEAKHPNLINYLKEKELLTK